MESLTKIEIHAQYDALAKTLELVTGMKESCKTFWEQAAPDQVVAVGCGSSFQLCNSIAMSAALHVGVPAASIAGGDLMLHMEQYASLFKGKPLLVTVSRSGSTSEVLYTVRKLKEAYPALNVVCIACTNDSVIAKESDFVIEIPWAFDNSVCQTRSVTNLYAAAMLFLAAAAGEEAVFDSYRMLAEGGNEYIAKNEELLKALGSEQFASAAVLCDGEGYGVAEEASLAFNEICYTPSVFKHVLDLRHGPIVLFNKETLVIAKLDSDGFDYQKALIADVRKRGAKVIVVSDEVLPEMEDVSAQIAFGQKLHTMASGQILLPVAQLISYYHALAVNADPDQPDGLDAWIKL